MNLKIKYRESFRPFAPSVLRDKVADIFEIDENGTEAAAATALVIDATSVRLKAPEKPIEFKCDKPFLFAVQDTKTGMVYFLGSVKELL